ATSTPPPAPRSPRSTSGGRARARRAPREWSRRTARGRAFRRRCQPGIRRRARARTRPAPPHARRSVAPCRRAGRALRDRSPWGEPTNVGLSIAQRLGELGAATNAELLVGALEVVLDRARRHHDGLGDLPAGQ